GDPGPLPVLIGLVLTGSRGTVAFDDGVKRPINIRCQVIALQTTRRPALPGRSLFFLAVS
ncbi:MAG TPA: hypothetical protein VIF64_08555, partial [Pyrinomonadaceae bacterium]